MRSVFFFFFFYFLHLQTGNASKVLSFYLPDKNNSTIARTSSSIRTRVHSLIEFSNYSKKNFVSRNDARKKWVFFLVRRRFSNFDLVYEHSDGARSEENSNSGSHQFFLPTSRYQRRGRAPIRIHIVTSLLILTFNNNLRDAITRHAR